MATQGSILEKRVIDACIEIALQNAEHGSLFVIELKSKRKESYYTEVFRKIGSKNGKAISVLDKKDVSLVKHLAILDGATIIGRSGELKAFGVTLKRQSTFIGHGKRHAFALGTSKIKDIVCILASEEDKHVRSFRDGVCIADIDSKTRVPASVKNKVVDILDTPLSKVLVASGIATSILTLNPIPAIITITGSSVIVSYGFDKIKKLFRI